jgi:bacterioferritin-associated ferredoxin
MFLCSCRAITEARVREAGERGIIDEEGLIEEFGLDAPECCGRCEREIGRFVAVARQSAPLELVRVLAGRA